MHPLRVLLIVSLGIAAAVAGAFAWTLDHTGSTFASSVVVGFLVFGAFLIPWAGVFFWAIRRASDLELLADRSREIVQGSHGRTITDRTYHGELDDLARSIEEIRATLVREKESFVEQRAAMEKIVASLGEGLLAVDAKGRVVFANERAARIFGHSGSLVGSRFVEVVRSQSVFAAFDRALAGEASVDRLRVPAGGEERQIELRVFPVGASDVAAVALFIDVTDIERLQRIRRDFLDDFSHEVRTPLAGLRSAVETFEAGGLTESQDEQLRQVMARQLSRIERLVRDLSELNQIETGQIVLERRPTDLYELMQELVEDLARRVGAEGLVRIEGEHVAGDVDPSRIQQVFSNVLDNAWKHGGRRGAIEVVVGHDGDQALVAISDQGEGIPQHETERIFNRFYRVDKSRSQQVPGVGLGLAIAKHLVLAHSGSIRALNRPGGGATFEIRVPAA